MQVQMADMLTVLQDRHCIELLDLHIYTLDDSYIMYDCLQWPIVRSVVENKKIMHGTKKTPMIIIMMMMAEAKNDSNDNGNNSALH